MQVILKTVQGGERLVPLIVPKGNSLVVDILDATLSFSIRNGVSQTNPAPGISLVRLDKIDDSRIRLTITGENQTPGVDIVPGRNDLVLSVTAEGVKQEPDRSIEVIVTGESEDNDYNTNEAEDFNLDTNEFQQNEAFSPRVGLVYKPIPDLSLYASYSRSLTQSVGEAFGGGVFDPERGTQYELGVKGDISDRLSATLALYDLTRTNVSTQDPNNPNFQIQTGEQNSQGVELYVAGEILPGWNITGGYAYTDAVITEDNLFEEGNRLNNSPENAVSLWTTYEIQQGSLQGLGFGAGLFFVGERQGDLENSFELPSYTRTDAAIFYERGKFRTALSIRNLFDIDYFEAADSDLEVFPGEPFTVSGSVSVEF